MITVLESIRLSTQYLSEKGIDSPRTNAELLLAGIIGCKRLELYLSFDRPLTEIELKQYREFLKRRGNFEPLQYILGTVEFYGLELNVDSNVLIPRPETEILVETIIKQFSKEQQIVALDIGCGSGNISIALAVNLPLAKIYSTDISNGALAVAKKNSEKFNVHERINFIKHNILKDSLDSLPLFNVIVSNPPYVSKESYAELQKEIRNYEPREAVTDGKDGYTFFKAIAEAASIRLKENGKLFFEIAHGQSDVVKNILMENKFSNIRVIKDYQGIDRVIFGERI
jgi:release factor glutamine methyltransferase